MTNIAKAVEESDNIAKNHPVNMTPQAIIKRQSILGMRVKNNYHHAVRNLIRAAGGRQAVSSGVSRSLGHSGISGVSSWVNMMETIRECGLEAWLTNKGRGSLNGKTCHDIVEIITNFINEDFVALDDTAAKEALESIMELLEKRLDGNPENFDAILHSVMSSDEIKNYIDHFFGIYIYSHLSQDFSEKIEKERGSEVMNQVMTEIKDLIIDDVSRGVHGRKAGQVNWNGEEGKQFIKDEFNRIIKIVTNNED
ncbi:MAG: hypothetical protein RR330_05855 [Alistipes sp.]